MTDSDNDELNVMAVNNTYPEFPLCNTEDDHSYTSDVLEDTYVIAHKQYFNNENDVCKNSAYDTQECEDNEQILAHNSLTQTSHYSEGHFATAAYGNTESPKIGTKTDTGLINNNDNSETTTSYDIIINNNTEADLDTTAINNTEAMPIPVLPVLDKEEITNRNHLPNTKTTASLTTTSNIQNTSNTQTDNIHNTVVKTQTNQQSQLSLQTETATDNNIDIDEHSIDIVLLKPIYNNNNNHDNNTLLSDATSNHNNIYDIKNSAAKDSMILKSDVTTTTSTTTITTIITSTTTSTTATRTPSTTTATITTATAMITTTIPTTPAASATNLSSSESCSAIINQVCRLTIIFNIPLSIYSSVQFNTNNLINSIFMSYLF